MITLSAFAACGPNERHHFPPTSPRSSPALALAPFQQFRHRSTAPPQASCRCTECARALHANTDSPARCSPFSPAKRPPRLLLLHTPYVPEPPARAHCTCTHHDCHHCRARHCTFVVQKPSPLIDEPAAGRLPNHPEILAVRLSATPSPRCTYLLHSPQRRRTHSQLRSPQPSYRVAACRAPPPLTRLSSPSCRSPWKVVRERMKERTIADTAHRPVTRRRGLQRTRRRLPQGRWRHKSPTKYSSLSYRCPLPTATRSAF
ncbi:hypothetical protein BV20DRAFT_350523 [Pilatotrama ljubarskyi]|nr:hypothetical protein BV20DRAFT_350523 [Pilatotrama ljubarskyi]